MKIITIDGPAGSGKSTIAKILAEKLGYYYIDSGALYRSFAYWVDKYDIDINDKILVNSFNIEYSWKNNMANLILDGIDISLEIRSEFISNKTSLIASNKIVRNIITEKQKIIASENNVVLEGRDAGTVVFPNAYKKFFLTASLEERATRRANQIKSDYSLVDVQNIKKDIEKRDFLDTSRGDAPLFKAFDAIELDTTGMNINEVVIALMEMIN